jgi:integrase
MPGGDHTPGLHGFRCGAASTLGVAGSTQPVENMARAAQPFINHDLCCARFRRVPTVTEVTTFDTVSEDEMRRAAVRKGQAGERPTTESGTVVAFPKTPSRQDEGTSDQPARREYLTEREVDELCDAARQRGRYGHRDATMILLAFRHGLRVSELIALRWEQVDLAAGRLQVIRRKGSDDSVQPLSGVEIRALRRVKREQGAGSRYLFLTERGAPMTANGFFKMLTRAAESVGMDGVHPHLLRHACGFKLVNQGVDTRTLAAYLGHRQIANTARYTKMDARRFDGFWQD